MTSQRSRDRLIALLKEKKISSSKVIAAIQSIPRHLFVDEGFASRAYDNTPLPIGYGQTISQPYVVAKMTTALLSSGPMQKVLEIGTGCGYQTAVLASVADKVYTVERIKGLHNKAQHTLNFIGVDNVQFYHGDGHLGWKKHAPYDAILISAAARKVPSHLFDQLNPDYGRMVVPSGPCDKQNLLLISLKNGIPERHFLDKVNFVPLIEGEVICHE